MALGLPQHPQIAYLIFLCAVLCNFSIKKCTHKMQNSQAQQAQFHLVEDLAMYICIRYGSRTTDNLHKLLNYYLHCGTVLQLEHATLSEPINKSNFLNKITKTWLATLLANLVTSCREGMAWLLPLGMKAAHMAGRIWMYEWMTVICTCPRATTDPPLWHSLWMSAPSVPCACNIISICMTGEWGEAWWCHWK